MLFLTVVPVVSKPHYEGLADAQERVPPAGWGAARANPSRPGFATGSWERECSRCARRTMLFLKVVLVVSKPQYEWVKNGDAPQKERQLQNGLRTALRGLKRQVGTDPSKAAERQRMWGQTPHAMSCPPNGVFRPSRLKTRRNRGRFVREPEIFVFWRRFVQICFSSDGILAATKRFSAGNSTADRGLLRGFA